MSEALLSMVQQVQWHLGLGGEGPTPPNYAYQKVLRGAFPCCSRAYDTYPTPLKGVHDSTASEWMKIYPQGNSTNPIFAQCRNL